MSNTSISAVVTLRDVNHSLSQVRETLAVLVARFDTALKEIEEQKDELEKVRQRIEKHDRLFWWAFGAAGATGSASGILASFLGG